MANPEQSSKDLSDAFTKKLSLASRSVHADDYINNHQAVAPPLHVSTTFRYSRDPEKLQPWTNLNPNAPHDSHIYSRDSAPNTTRFEALLTSILGAPSLTYSSGLAAFHALIVFLNPKRVAIGAGYHGCHGVLSILHKLNGLQQLDLTLDSDLALLQKGDVIHVETPLNPTGEARDLSYYRRLADEKGCYLTVDATFAPPPLLDPFKWGADIVMHSGTKYFGGHSDMLAGVLAVRPDREQWVRGLREERLHLGSVMGSLEGWLGVRSLRTLELRVRRQSENAQRLVEWLDGEVKARKGVVGEVVEKVVHASLQEEAKVEGSWLREQMPEGYGPVFAIWMKEEAVAKRLPSTLHLFHHATSLGGVESLIEWRAMSDQKCDKRLLRVSVGVEGWEDLKEDLIQGFEALKTVGE
ncbi:Cys/Met metabolism PLP-dependent enzyme-domain-containing protein [Podospora aff. communis PSN243]|uniref:Cys/Met metabolism PLP-dependent enzyme-domain-containing protein n=1 Tax=Podospora aff. communis PSN243 TaxID=3040156 RepID=A0AAV9GLU9_9PEZI|nr:Cys/Met metabolism PLP-dependent enzyme-domain-containing protein [Podospora aff. communis PSN243]